MRKPHSTKINRLFIRSAHSPEHVWVTGYGVRLHRGPETISLRDRAKSGIQTSDILLEIAPNT